MTTSVDHYCSPPLTGARLPDQLQQCMCGTWWRTVTANSILTGGPLIIWARVTPWDLRTRWAIARQRRGATR